jgi:hypothetical protein
VTARDKPAQCRLLDLLIAQRHQTMGAVRRPCARRRGGAACAGTLP